MRKYESIPIEEEATSGYTEDIDKIVETAAGLHVENGFNDITEDYVSRTGHTRLFSAIRYGKQYILKGLKPDYMYTPIYRQALVKEFEIGLQLDHPNICRTIGMEDVGEFGSVIVMEYIDGCTLQNILDDKTLTVEQAHKYAHQLAEALDYMHSKQIMHRDLKPSNVMITHNGHNVKLIDFSLSDSDSFAVLKLPAGTQGYIAPEMFLPGACGNVATDMYSYGMVLRDMALLTNDKELLRISKVCTCRNAALRPVDKKTVFATKRTSFRQYMVVIVLALLSVMFAIYIGVTLYGRSAQPALGTEQTFSDEPGSGNRVLDYHRWPASHYRVPR